MATVGGCSFPVPVRRMRENPFPRTEAPLFGFQSVIVRIIQHKELIVLLDNTESPKLLDIALVIRSVLAENP